MAKFRKGFRRVNNKKNKKHPAYIYAKVGDEYKFIGITHAKITDNIKNIPLEKNPNPKDKRPAYLRPRPDKAHKAEFGGRYNNWNFSKKDKEKVNKIISNK